MKKGNVEGNWKTAGSERKDCHMRRVAGGEGIIHDGTGELRGLKVCKRTEWRRD